MTETATWRLIRSGPLPGAMNMALDDALLQAVADGDSLPVLRLYRWQPAALTVGYAQQVDAGVDLDVCREVGLDVVRRPTGGRAVLHDVEVTYAVIAPCTPPFGVSVTQNYRVIAEVLATTLRTFGLPVELVPGQPRAQQGQAVCFSAPAQYELLVAGCKVAGCAQKRRGGAFLQHGSIPLELDLALLDRLLPGQDEDTPAARLGGVGWLNRFAESPLSVEAVETVLVDSFAANLGLIWQASCPTPTEAALTDELCRRYYADPLWTRQGPGGQAVRDCGGRAT